MYLSWFFCITAALWFFPGVLAATETQHGSFLQTSRALPRMAGQVARATTRVLEAHQRYQRPQQRIIEQPQRRPQMMPKLDRRPLAAARYQSARQPAEPFGGQGRRLAEPFLQPLQNVKNANLPSDLRPLQATTYAGPAPQGKEVAEETPAAASPLYAEAAMKELAKAATALGEARRSKVEDSSSEALTSLHALQYLSLPQLGHEPSHTPLDLTLAEVFSPGEKQTQIRKVSAAIQHFVGITSRAAIFEVQATQPPLSSLIPGVHNLRLGFGTLWGAPASVPPIAVLQAAEEGGKNMNRVFKLLEKILEQGYTTVIEASEASGLLLPIYGVEIPSYGQAYAWVGHTVFSPIAAITAAYECTLKDIFDSATSTSIPSGPTSQPKSPPVKAALGPLNATAKEFVALRILSGVCSLHALGFVHGALSLQSVVVNGNGQVFLSDMEGVITVGQEKPCQPASPLPTPTSEPPPTAEPERQPFSNPAASSTEAAKDKKSEAEPVQAPISSAKGPGPLCQIDEKILQQKMDAESVALGFLLHEVLTGGKLPFGLTKGPVAVEAIAALQQGTFNPPEGASSIVAELQAHNISEKWRACIDALLRGTERLTALQVAATHVPEAASMVAAPVPGPHG